MSLHRSVEFAGLNYRTFIKTRRAERATDIKRTERSAPPTQVINGDEIFNICKAPAATSVSSRFLCRSTTIPPPRVLAFLAVDPSRAEGYKRTAARREKYRCPDKEKRKKERGDRVTAETRRKLAAAAETVRENPRSGRKHLEPRGRRESNLISPRSLCSIRNVSSFSFSHAFRV